MPLINRLQQRQSDDIPASHPTQRDEIPAMLRPYDCLGVYLDYKRDLSASLSVTGDCPFCGKEKRFNVTLKDGLWRCPSCNSGTAKGGGNVYTFLRVLHNQSMRSTTEQDYKALAAEFTLLYPDTLRAWGLCRSIIDGVWLAPAYNVQNGTYDGGKICTLYRYANYGGPKKRWGVTTGLGHGLHGPDLPTPVGGVQVTKHQKTGPVYRCEGLKDGMALWEILLRCKRDDEGNLLPTGNEGASLLHDCSVIAVPGCGIFQPSWAAVSAGRVDCSLYHNDHPKERPIKSGRFVQPGLDGTQHALDVISRATSPPRECKYLRWGETTYHDPDLPDGYDIRDHLAGAQKNNTLAQRIKGVGDILQRLQPIPQEWMPGHETGPSFGMSIRQEACRDWKTLMNALRDAYKVTVGIERAFASMLASILSVPSVGDQLWLLLIGPPSSAKTSLCEAIAANRQYVLPKDSLTGIFSGWQAGLEKGENLSMVAEMHNKTVVFKDGDTLLRNPQQAQIMSQLRALYDRHYRQQYKNKMSKDWEGINTTVIIAGTATLLELDAAERGARYLMIDIQPTEDYDLEDEINRRAANRSFDNMNIHANGTLETKDAPEVVRLKQLTAGYISYLRENALSLINTIQDPGSKARDLCCDLATFCSYMRCRIPKGQDEKVERERPYRLTSQLVRLAKGLAVVYNRTTINDEILQHVRSIALDTSKGKVMNLCDYIRACGKDGVSSPLIAQAVGETHEKTLETLRFLRKIQAVDVIMPVTSMSAVRSGQRPRWVLSPRLASIYDRLEIPVLEVR